MSPPTPSQDEWPDQTLNLSTITDPNLSRIESENIPYREEFTDMSQDYDTHTSMEGDLQTNNGTDMSQEIVTYGVQHLLDTADNNMAASE